MHLCDYSNPCKNDANCTKSDRENDSEKFTCICAQGFTGINCENGK